MRQKETDEEYGKPRVRRYTSGEGLSKNRGLEVGNESYVLAEISVVG